MKLDKSAQGFFDQDIVRLLDIINKKYRTSSSCSGRITLMRGTKKGSAKWLYKTHTCASARRVYDIIQKEGTLRFLYEPLIVHMQCKNKTEAEKVLHMIQSNGFKKSGLLSLKNWTIEINDTGKMESIVTRDLSLKYLQFLVHEMNQRLKKTKQQIKRLEELFTKDL